ncbi:MAG: histidine kinase [Clostridiaceae bacterium]|nr:histidine kinase [Clostridiaceae bacterium]
MRTSISGYVLSILIYGFNDVVLRVFEEADGITMSSLASSSWFYPGMNAGNRLVWPGLRHNLSFRMSAVPEVLPIVRPVLFADTLDMIGLHTIAFHPDLVNDVCRRYGDGIDDALFLVDNRGSVVFASRPSVGFDSAVAVSQVQSPAAEAGHFTTGSLSGKQLICYQRSDYSGMMVFQVMDYGDYENLAATAFSLAIVLLLSVSLSVLVTVTLTTRLTRPIERIREHMARISGGDFSRDPLLEGPDEIGQLGQGINDLATNVDLLLRRNLEEEREKKALEFRLLQNQVNPHFIYNALNAIRMMAMIQKSQGIYDTANALGALLKETSKGAMEKITLREEFDLIEHFIHIHNIRKQGLIRTEYDLGDALADRLVVRFLLQPIVENAILHGFEGKRGLWRIWVSAEAANGRVTLTVRDNGRGIAPDKLEALVADPSESQGRRFNAVGLNNVREQIRHVYGSAYGMTLDSQIGVGTTVSVVIPEESAPIAAAPEDTPPMDRSADDIGEGRQHP